MGDSEDDDEEQWAVPLETSILNKSLSPHKSCDSLLSNEKKEDTFNEDVAFSSCISEPLFGHRRTIIQIDIDCFYAQVEMIRNPSLRDKPLGIQQKYIVVTCNYKAREFGVTKLMSLKEAKEKCPQLILVSGEDLTHYRAMSYKITEFLQKYTSVVERLGFDENFLDVSPLVESYLKRGHSHTSVVGFVYKVTWSPNSDSQGEKERTCGCGCHLRLAIGSQIAAKIRATLADELGITCCAGISHNKLLAKLVGSVNKPNKQTTLFPEDALTFMVNLQNVRKIPGVGYAAVKKLAGMGVCSVTDLQNASLDMLQSEFEESLCWKMKQLSRGIDETEVKQTGQPQSISDEDSFKKCSSEREAKEKILELLNSLMIRLHEDGRTPQTIRLTIRKYSTVNKYGNRESRQCAIPNYIFSNFGPESFSKVKLRLCDVLMPLFHKLVDVRSPFHLTLINVCFAKLVENAKNKISSFFGQSSLRSPHSISSSTDNRNSLLSNKTSDSLNQTSVSCDSENHRVDRDMIDTGNKLQNTETCVDKTRGAQPFMQNRKRLFSPSDENSLDKEKKARLDVVKSVRGTDSSEVNTNLTDACCANEETVRNPCGLIPAGVDEEFFNALPADIQAEMLQRNSSNVSTETQETVRTHSRLKAGPVKTSHSMKGQQKMDSFYRRGSSEMSKKSDEAEDGRKSDSPLVSPFAQTATSLQTSSQSAIERGNAVNMNRISEQDTVIPTDIDKDIFMSLPSDVQKELLREWTQKSDKPLTNHNRAESSKVPTGTKHSQKKKSSPSILKFCQKRQ